MISFDYNQFFLQSEYQWFSNICFVVGKYRLIVGRAYTKLLALLSESPVL